MVPVYQEWMIFKKPDSDWIRGRLITISRPFQTACISEFFGFGRDVVREGIDLTVAIAPNVRRHP